MLKTNQSCDERDLAVIGHWTAQRESGRQTLSVVPVEVYERGKEDIAVYFQSLDSDGHSRRETTDYRAKICVVGPSKWGKTSFIKTLTSGEATIEDEDVRTVGVDLFTWTFSASSSHHTVTLWDFAGQDEYQSTHTLFFSRRTLYVLCINLKTYSNLVFRSAETMDSFWEQNIYRWVRVICAHHPDAMFVCVGTHLDAIEKMTTVQHIEKDLFTRIARMERDDLDAIEREWEKLELGGKDDTSTSSRKSQLIDQKNRRPRILSQRLLAVSNKDLSGIDDVRQQLERHIVESEIGFPMPPIYAGLHRFLRARSAAAGSIEDVASAEVMSTIEQTFVTIQGLYQCIHKDEAFASVNNEALVAMLHVFHDIGDVLWFDTFPDSAIAQTIFLNPNVIIAFVRQVINHHLCDPVRARDSREKSLHELVRDEGRVTHRLLRRLKLWQDVDTKTVLRLKTLLHQFNLAYPSTTGKMMSNSDLIIPLYWKIAPSTKPDSEFHDTDALPQRVHWEFVFHGYLPENVFEKLGVQSYSAHYSCDRQFGRNWFMSAKAALFQSRVLKDSVMVEGSLFQALVIDVHAIDRQVAWEQLIWYCLSMEQLLQEYPGLWVTRYVVSMESRKRWNVDRLLDEKRHMMEAGPRTIAAIDDDVLPSDMDWYTDRHQILNGARSQSVTDSTTSTQLEEAVRTITSKIDFSHEAQMKRIDAAQSAQTALVAGLSNRSLYPALWTLEMLSGSATTEVVLKIRSELSGICFHEDAPIRLLIGDKFVAQYGLYIQHGLSIFSSVVPYGKGIVNAIASECQKHIDRTIAVHNLIEGVELSENGIINMQENRSLSPDATLLMFKSLLEIYDPEFQPLKMSQLCGLECAIHRRTGKYVWAHRTEIEARMSELCFKNDGFNSIPVSVPRPRHIPSSSLRMRLTIVEARGIPTVRRLGVQRPYCKWKIISVKTERMISAGRTAAHDESATCPSWQLQQFVIELSEDELDEGISLVVHVKCPRLITLIKTQICIVRITLTGEELRLALNEGAKRLTGLLTPTGEPAGTLEVQLQGTA